jgi:ferritin-like metal-binding protein YciE
MSKLNNLQDLFEIMLRDVYDAEKQIIHAMPKMTKKAANPKLKTVLESQMKEAVEQQERLELVFRLLQMKPKVKHCSGMEGIFKEAMDLLGQDGEPAVLDAACIAAFQMVKHYEIAAYGTLRAWSRTLSHPSEVQSLLNETEKEEKLIDADLSGLAAHVNAEALATGLVSVGQ